MEFGLTKTRRATAGGSSTNSEAANSNRNKHDPSPYFKNGTARPTGVALPQQTNKKRTVRIGMCLLKYLIMNSYECDRRRGLVVVVV